MATSKPSQWARYTHLPTQQRRLRHLTSIAARNLLLHVERFAGEDIISIQTYFSLHISENAKAFYKSESVSGSLNPTWRSFDLRRHVDESLTSSPAVIVRVWAGNCKKYHLVCEWTVDLSGLVHLGNKIQKDGGKYQQNSIIFGMFDEYYGTPVDPKDNVDVLQCALKVDQAAVRTSYSVNSLLRIQTVLRAIKQTRVMATKIRTHIEDRLTQSQNTTKKMSASEQLVLGVNKMREDLVWRSMHLQKEKDNHEHLTSNNLKRRSTLGNKYEVLEDDKDALYNRKKAYFQSREDYVSTNAQLVMRRKQLISELVFIYPIVEEKNSHTVCRCKLPNSEDFYGEDETMIAVSLGYTCHLVQMISHFLDVPLRYPVIHRVSRSMIHDHILDKLTDKEKDFPLYSKGKEKFQFNYGVYLLNKNIAQLRYYCGLGTTDLRLTLPNLRSLLELRLGVKFESSNVMFPGQSLTATPTLSSPPTVSNSVINANPTPHNAAPQGQTSEYLTVDGQEHRGASGHASPSGPLSVSGTRGLNPEDDLPAFWKAKRKKAKENDIDAQSINSLSKNSDDTDVSSSDENSYKAYRSKFKHWPEIAQTSSGISTSKTEESLDSAHIVEDALDSSSHAGKPNGKLFSNTASSKNDIRNVTKDDVYNSRDGSHDSDIRKRTEALTSSSKPFKQKKTKKNKDPSPTAVLDGGAGTLN